MTVQGLIYTICLVFVILILQRSAVVLNRAICRHDQIYNEKKLLMFQKFSLKNLRNITCWRTKVGQGGVEIKNAVKYPLLSRRTLWNRWEHGPLFACPYYVSERQTLRSQLPREGICEKPRGRSLSGLGVRDRWASYLTSLSLSYQTCRIEIIFA